MTPQGLGKILGTAFLRICGGLLTIALMAWAILIAMTPRGGELPSVVPKSIIFWAVVVGGLVTITHAFHAGMRTARVIRFGRRPV